MKATQWDLSVNEMFCPDVPLQCKIKWCSTFYRYKDSFPNKDKSFESLSKTFLPIVCGVY